MLVFINNLGYTGFLVGDWDDALSEMEAVLADELDTRTASASCPTPPSSGPRAGESIDDTLAK